LSLTIIVPTTIGSWVLLWVGLKGHEWGAGAQQPARRSETIARWQGCV